MGKRHTPGLDAERVNGLLRSRDWRPVDLARAMDVDDAQITKWLKYGQAPTGYDAARMAQVLGVTAAFLYGLPEEPTVANKVSRLVNRMSEERQAAVFAFVLHLSKPDEVEVVKETDPGDEAEAESHHPARRNRR